MICREIRRPVASERAGRLRSSSSELMSPEDPRGRTARQKSFPTPAQAGKSSFPRPATRSFSAFWERTFWRFAPKRARIELMIMLLDIAVRGRAHPATDMKTFPTRARHTLAEISAASSVSGSAVSRIGSLYAAASGSSAITKGTLTRCSLRNHTCNSLLRSTSLTTRSLVPSSPMVEARRASLRD